MSQVFNIAGKKKDFSRTAQSQLLPIKTATPFFHLIYHPYRYFWAGKAYGWLPDIGQMYLHAGANGVDERNPKRGILHVEDSNASTVIRIEDLPEELRDCVSESKTRSGETHYHWAWISYTVIGNNTRQKKDPNAKKDFLKKLVEHRVVPEIDPEVAEILTEELADRLQRLKQKSSLKPGDLVVKNEIKSLEASLKEIAEYQKQKVN